MERPNLSGKSTNNSNGHYTSTSSNLRVNCQNDLKTFALVKDTINALKLQKLQTFGEGYLIPL